MRGQTPASQNRARTREGAFLQRAVTKTGRSVLPARTKSAATAPSSHRRTVSSVLSWVPPIILFVFLAALLAPMFGLEYDELLFARGLLVPQDAAFLISSHHHFLSIMLMSYVGALKSWLYAPIFAIFGMSTWSIRLPCILLAAATIYFLARLVSRIAGWPSALFVLWLLSTDVVFAFTATFDWGPVVIQNLLLVIGLLCVEKWQRHPSPFVLFLAGTAFGLALWDKALFLWNFSAMAVVFWGLYFRKVRLLLTRPIAGVFFLGLLIGASPLITYNLLHRNQTLSESARFSTAEVAAKFQYLKFSIDGRTAIAPFIEVDHPMPDREARPLGDVATRLARMLPWTPPSWRFAFYAVVVPLGLLLADARRRRWILFFFASASLAWLESALTIGAGASIHHSVLIWPLLYGATAVAAGVIAARLGRFGTWLLALLVMILAVRGLEQMDLLYSHLITYSPAVQWTNADVPLAAWLDGHGVKTVITSDWGLDSTVRVRTQNHINVLDEAWPLRDHQFDEKAFASCHPPDCVVVGHPRVRELYSGNDAEMERGLASAGLQRNLVAQMVDSHGRPSIQVYSIRGRGRN